MTIGIVVVKGKGEVTPHPALGVLPSKTAVFRAELPEMGQAQSSLRPGLRQDFSIPGWHLENGS